MDCSPPGSFVHRIFQARILEWVAISYSRGSSQPKNQTQVSSISCVGRQILTTVLPGKPKLGCTSVQFSLSVLSYSLRPHGLQHTRLPCLSSTPGAYSNSCPSSWWCHPTISLSAIPFSSCLQSFPALGSFLTNQFFLSGGHSTGALVSASVLPMNIQDWFPLGLPGLISLLSK